MFKSASAIWFPPVVLFFSGFFASHCLNKLFGDVGAAGTLGMVIATASLFFALAAVVTLRSQLARWLSGASRARPEPAAAAKPPADVTAELHEAAHRVGTFVRGYLLADGLALAAYFVILVTAIMAPRTELGGVGPSEFVIGGVVILSWVIVCLSQALLVFQSPGPEEIGAMADLVITAQESGHPIPTAPEVKVTVRRGGRISINNHYSELVRAGALSSDVRR